jgi:hypothetical protein
MEEREQYKADYDEIDLSFIFKKIGNFFKNLLIGFLKIIAFYYNKKWILIPLVIIGGILGYFWEKSFDDKYNNNFIVAANYESSDYLYNKIDAINSKIKLKDSTYLKKVFGEYHDKAKTIEIEPVIDIYEFVADSESNQELFEFLSEDGGDSRSNQELFELLSEDEDMTEFIKDPVNSRNYPHHIINLIVKGNERKVHQSISDNFFNYLNTNQYYNFSKKESLKTLSLKLDENALIRNQVDGVINSVIQNQTLGTKNPILSINDNQSIDKLLRRKAYTIGEDLELRTQIENKQKVIQIVDANYQIEFEDSVLRKDKKFILPLLLIIIFSGIYLLQYIIKKGKSFLAKNNL